MKKLINKIANIIHAVQQHNSSALHTIWLYEMYFFQCLECVATVSDT